MGLALTTTFAVCLWVILWALGISGLDGILLTLLIILIGATLRSVARFLPGRA